MQASVLAQGEVLSPGMTPGMKQGHDEVSLRIYRCDIRALLQITTNATQAEIIRII
jgi:hypothetical protein